MARTTAHRAVPDTRKPTTYTDHITEELHRYEEHLRDMRGLTEGSCRQRARIVGRLPHRKFAGRPVDIAELRAEDVRRFLASQLDIRRTPSNASQLASALRSYFRYRTSCGDQVGKLIAVISNPVHWKLASLPRSSKPTLPSTCSTACAQRADHRRLSRWLRALPRLCRISPWQVTDRKNPGRHYARYGHGLSRSSGTSAT